MRELIVEEADRRHPAYIISPRRRKISYDQNIKLLLSETLDATSLAVGGHNRFGSSLLHVKTDSVEGVGLNGLRVANPYDVVGGIGGSRDFKETIYTNNGTFSAQVALGAEDSKCIQVMLKSVEPGTPTLVIGRRDIESPGIAPDLIDAREADPYFGLVRLMRLDFNELVKRVINKLPGRKYVLVD